MRVHQRLIVTVVVLAAILTLAAGWPTVACVNGSTAIQFTLKPIPITSVHHSWQAPHIRNENGTSSNWSGYAAYVAAPKRSSSPTFNAVEGSWAVPKVVASASADTYSSTWVGIDGYSDSTVEQIGTEQDWDNGVPEYYAWFEMYPLGAYEITHFPIKPGDTISAEVQYTSNGSFKLSIANITEKVSFSTTQRLQSAQRLSAEWIEEAPWWNGVLPLADFGTVNFSNCYASLSNGTEGAIDGWAWNYDQLIMETSNGTVKALPSRLSSNGEAFGITWHHQ
jgi:hypothetical protein